LSEIGSVGLAVIAEILTGPVDERRRGSCVVLNRNFNVSSQVLIQVTVQLDLSQNVAKYSLEII
jgi:hypothetical protein